jgi:molybdopterin-containing oxidoreductase family membrane subunit
MWLKRYIIVVPTLSSPFMPPSLAPGTYLTYFPTVVEWTITASAFAASCLFYIIFSKIFPIVSIWEVAETAQDEPAPARQTDGEMEAVPCAT